MRRIAPVAAVIAVAASLGVPAAGAQTASGQLAHVQEFEMWIETFDPSGDAGMFGNLTVKVTRGLDASVPGPVTSVRAQGFFDRWDNQEQTYESASFPEQDLPATAFVVDPVGNEVVVSMSLTSSTNQDYDFDFTASRPGSTFLVVPGPNEPAPNVWFDQATGEAEARASTNAGLRRFNYETSGDFAGESFVSPSQTCCVSVSATLFQGVRATPRVDVTL